MLVLEKCLELLLSVWQLGTLTEWLGAISEPLLVGLTRIETEEGTPDKAVSFQFKISLQGFSI